MNGEISIHVLNVHCLWNAMVMVCTVVQKVTLQLRAVDALSGCVHCMFYDHVICFNYFNYSESFGLVILNTWVLDSWHQDILRLGFESLDLELLILDYKSLKDLMTYHQKI